MSWLFETFQFWLDLQLWLKLCLYRVIWESYWYSEQFKYYSLYKYFFWKSCNVGITWPAIQTPTGHFCQNCSQKRGLGSWVCTCPFIVWQLDLNKKVQQRWGRNTRQQKQGGKQNKLLLETRQMKTECVLVFVTVCDWISFSDNSVILGLLDTDSKRQPNSRD